MRVTQLQGDFERHPFYNTFMIFSFITLINKSFHVTGKTVTDVAATNLLRKASAKWASPILKGAAVFDPVKLPATPSGAT